MTQSIDGKQLDRYRRDGFVIVRGLFAKDEAGLILDAALADERLRKAAYSRTDSEGNQTLMSVWDQLGDDITLSSVNLTQRCRGIRSHSWCKDGGKCTLSHGRAIRVAQIP